MEFSESHSTSKPFRLGGLDVSTSSLPSDGSKEHEETRLPEEVPRKFFMKETQLIPEVGDHERQLQDMQVTLRDLKKKLEEETQEKESLNNALAEALAALAESEKAAENAQQGNAIQVQHVAVQQVAVAETEILTQDESMRLQDSVKGKTEGGHANTLQVSQSESSIGTGVPSESMHVGMKANQSLEHAVSQVSVQTQADLSPSHAEGQPMKVDADSLQLEELERRLEETQRQLEACLQAAAKSPDEMAVSPTAIAVDDKLLACLDLRYLGDFDPPEVLLKAAMGQLYAVLCLQTKAKSFLAAQHLHELRSASRRVPPQRAPRPASAMTYQASRQAVHRQSLPQVFPRGRHDELDEDASTARRRWSDRLVPPLALGQLNQFNEWRSPSTADTRILDSEVYDEKPPEVVVPRGSAISAVRAGSAAKSKLARRPSSSPGAFAQKRNDNPPAKPLRRAMSAGGAAASRTRAQSACRSRPQSHSRKSRGNDGYIPQAELWLIKNRALASMMWPPLSEAARGRRPKTKTACVRCLPDPKPPVQGV